MFVTKLEIGKQDRVSLISIIDNGPKRLTFKGLCSWHVI